MVGVNIFCLSRLDGHGEMGMEVRYLNYINEVCPFLYACLSLRKGRFIYLITFFQFNLDKDVVDVRCNFCLHGYPNHDEYTISFPTAAAWAKIL